MPSLVRTQGAFLQRAGNDNVPARRRVASNTALAFGTAALLVGITLLHSLAAFL